MYVCTKSLGASQNPWRLLNWGSVGFTEHSKALKGLAEPVWRGGVIHTHISAFFPTDMECASWSPLCTGGSRSPYTEEDLQSPRDYIHTFQSFPSTYFGYFMKPLYRGGFTSLLGFVKPHRDFMHTYICTLWSSFYRYGEGYCMKPLYRGTSQSPIGLFTLIPAHITTL